MRCSGSAMAALSRVLNWAAMPSIVAASNRSVAYSKNPVKRPSASTSSSVMSKRATLGSTSSRRAEKPGKRAASIEAFWRMNMIRTSGLPSLRRAIWSARSTSSIGRSWLR